MDMSANPRDRIMSLLGANRVPVPANPTKGYIAGTGLGGNALAYVLDNKPWFNYFEIPRLTRDPFVNFLRNVWISPLQQVKWKVKASSLEVADCVDKTLTKFWRKYMAAIMRRYFMWGFAPGGVEYKVKRGDWQLDTVRPIEPRDARVLVVRDGEQRGEFAGFETRSTNPVLRPYALWFKGRGEYGRFYDQPPAASLFDAWAEYGTRGGARHLRQLGMRKHSISPAQMRYPEGVTQWEDSAGGVQEIPNKLLAMQILEYYESGANVVIPSGRDEKGNPLWELIPAESKLDAKSLSSYPDKLKEEMSEAVGMPFEVIKAAETGSGYSGRSVPYKAWLGVMDEYAGLLVDQVDDAPIRQLIHVNFGCEADYEIELESLVEQFEKMNGPESSPGGGPSAPDDGGDDDPTPRPAPPAPPQRQPMPRSQGQTQNQNGDSFAMSYGEAAPEIFAKVDKKGERVRTLAQLAMLSLQEEATESGDPEKYQDAMDELAALAGDNDSFMRVAKGKGLDSFEMAWEPYSGPRGGRGFKDTDTGRVRYQASQPGQRRERAKADAAKASDLIQKVRYSEGPEAHEHLAALVDHLPAMTVEKLRYARSMLGARFGNAKKRDAMIEALKAHAMGAMEKESEKVVETSKGPAENDFKTMPFPINESGPKPGDAKAGPVIDHPLEGLIATQKNLYPDRVKQYFDGREVPEAHDSTGEKSIPWGDGHPIEIVRKDGKNHITDGHHRATAAKLRGDTTIPARVIDLDAPPPPAPEVPAPAEPAKEVAPATKSQVEKKDFTSENGKMKSPHEMTRKEFQNGDTHASLVGDHLGYEEKEKAPGPYKVWIHADRGEDPSEGSFRTFANRDEYKRWIEDGGWQVPHSGRVVSEPKMYYRAGGLPSRWMSRNHAEGKSEGGVSVYATPHATSLAGAGGREWHHGMGVQVGVGSDDEPIIIPVGEWKKSKKNTHKQIVAEALASGKTVPPEVLADYPDLRPSPTTPDSDIIDLVPAGETPTALPPKAKITPEHVAKVAAHIKQVYDTAAQPGVEIESIRESLKQLEGLSKPQLIEVAKGIKADKGLQSLSKTEVHREVVKAVEGMWGAAQRVKQ